MRFSNTVGPAILGCPVEVPISGLDQPRVGVLAIRASALGAEAVKRRQGATPCDSEDRAIAVGPSILGCPIEVPISGLDQPRHGVRAVRARTLSAEAVQRRQRAARGDFEDSAIIRCPVKVSVGALDQHRFGASAVRAAKAEQRGESLRR